MFILLDTQCISYVGVGVIVSVAIFVAFKAGQVFKLRTIEKQIHELDLERLKQKTEYVLERLWGDTNGNVKLPEGLTFKEIVENAFIIDESIQEEILGLNKINFDLISNGAGGSYFVYILDVYAHTIL